MREQYNATLKQTYRLGVSFCGRWRLRKKRPLGIPTMQALHRMALIPVAETLADPNSYGFSPKRSAADAINQCFIVLAKKQSPQWVLDADIKACFDRIDHEWLYRHVPTDETVLRKWLKAGFSI